MVLVGVVMVVMVIVVLVKAVVVVVARESRWAMGGESGGGMGGFRYKRGMRWRWGFEEGSSNYCRLLGCVRVGGSR